MGFLTGLNMMKWVCSPLHVSTVRSRACTASEDLSTSVTSLHPTILSLTVQITTGQNTIPEKNAACQNLGKNAWMNLQQTKSKGC